MTFVRLLLLLSAILTALTGVGGGARAMAQPVQAAAAATRQALEAVAVRRAVFVPLASAGQVRPSEYIFPVTADAQAGIPLYADRLRE